MNFDRNEPINWPYTANFDFETPNLTNFQLRKQNTDLLTKILTYFDIKKPKNWPLTSKFGLNLTNFDLYKPKNESWNQNFDLQSPKIDLTHQTLTFKPQFDLFRQLLTLENQNFDL